MSPVYSKNFVFIYGSICMQGVFKGEMSLVTELQLGNGITSSETTEDSGATSYCCLLNCI